MFWGLKNAIGYAHRSQRVTSKVWRISCGLVTNQFFLSFSWTIYFKDFSRSLNPKALLVKLRISEVKTRHLSNLMSTCSCYYNAFSSMFFLLHYASNFQSCYFYFVLSYWFHVKGDRKKEIFRLSFISFNQEQPESKFEMI